MKKIKCNCSRTGDRLQMIRYTDNDGMTWKQGTIIVKRCLDCGKIIKEGGRTNGE